MGGLSDHELPLSPKWGGRRKHGQGWCREHSRKKEAEKVVPQCFWIFRGLKVEDCVRFLCILDLVISVIRQEPQAGLEPDFLWSGPCLESLIWLTEHWNWWMMGGKYIAEAMVSQSLWETAGKSSSIWENLEFRVLVLVFSWTSSGNYSVNSVCSFSYFSAQIL